MESLIRSVHFSQLIKNALQLVLFATLIGVISSPALARCPPMTTNYVCHENKGSVVMLIEPLANKQAYHFIDITITNGLFDIQFSNDVVIGDSNVKTSSADTAISLVNTTTVREGILLFGTVNLYGIETGVKIEVDGNAKIAEIGGGSEIKVAENGVALDITSHSGSGYIKNSGNVQAINGTGVKISSATEASLENSGWILGHIDMTGRNSTVINSGNIAGNLTLNGATTTFENNGYWQLDNNAITVLNGGVIKHNGAITLAEMVKPVTVKITGVKDFAYNGMLSLANNRVGDKLIISSENFHGGANSEMILEAILGSDLSGNTDITDTVIFDGTTHSGTTRLKVVNINGQGNETGNLLLVQGISTAGDGSEFILQSDQVIAGVNLHNQLKYLTINGVTGWYLSAASGVQGY